MHIVVYDEEEKVHVQSKLMEAKVDMDKIDFLVQETDDVWIRDNGPIFVKDKEGNLCLTLVLMVGEINIRMKMMLLFRQNK